jgi:hypothetical protein
MSPVSLSKDVKEVLDFIPGKKTEDKIVNLIIDVLTFRLRGCEEKIVELEAKYGMTFEEFKESWDGGKIADKHSHRVERDYMEWEGFQMEKKRWLSTLKNFKASVSKSRK